jgi:hypothetical protein
MRVNLLNCTFRIWKLLGRARSSAVWEHSNFFLSTLLNYISTVKDLHCLLRQHSKWKATFEKFCRTLFGNHSATTLLGFILLSVMFILLTNVIAACLFVVYLTTLFQLPVSKNHFIVILKNRYYIITKFILQSVVTFNWKEVANFSSHVILLPSSPPTTCWLFLVSFRNYITCELVACLFL